MLASLHTPLLIVLIAAGSLTAQDPPAGTPAPSVQDPQQETQNQDPKPDPDPDDELAGLDDLEGLDDLPGLDDIGSDAGSDTGLRVTNLKGFVESRLRHYFRDRGTPGLRDSQWIHELQFEMDLALTKEITGYFRPRFLIDSIDTDLVRTDPLELYATFSKPEWDLRVGMFVENWGIADTFNPVDVLNRRDLAYSIFDPVRLGEIGARFRLKLDGDDVIGEPTLSFYALPVFQTAAFPTQRSRWSFSPPPGDILDNQASRPENDEKWFLAARAQSTLSTGPANADVQLVAARGPDRFPVFSVVANGQGGLDLTPEYFGSWTLGGGIRAVPNAEALADYTLKAEVVYKVPYRTDAAPPVLPDEYLQYAFGFDRLIPGIFSDQDQLTVTVEWVGETGANDSTAGFRPFDDDLVLRAFWEANDFARTSLELRGFVDFQKDEWVVETILERQLRFIHEDLKLDVGLQWIDAASSGSFFSLFPNNSNFSVGLRMDF